MPLGIALIEDDVRSRAVITLAVLVAALVCGGWLLERGFSRRSDSASSARLFADVFARVQQHYVDTLSVNELYEKATAGMMHELHDPYSTYLAADRARQLNETTTGMYGGIGVQVDVRNDGIVVVAPMAGTPAERAGIIAGDRIIAIDGRSTTGWTFDEAMKALRGPKGSPVRLSVDRASAGARLAFSVERAEIHVHSVRHAEMLDPRVGYVALTVFSDSSVGELRRAIDSLTLRGMQTLVLDLRNDPGGLLEQGVAVSDLFLDQGQKVVTMRGRAAGATQEFKDGAPQRWPTLKLMVLVNESSASAAEIVAGALQDHDRAVLLGSTSYGKGSAQSVYSFADGAALKLTTARWFTPSGRSIQKKRLASDDSGGDDAADSAALASAKRAVFHTDAGRTIYGGGGIAPDIMVSRVDTTHADGAFARALGKNVPKFRDALSEYAVQVRVAHGVTSPDFEVTQAMRDALWQHMVAHGIPMPRATYDSASSLLSRRIGDEVTLYVFGPDAAFDRQLRNDRVVTTAIGLASGAQSERELLARAATRSSRKQDQPLASTR